MLSERTLAVAFIVLGWSGALVFAWSTIAFAMTGGTAWMLVPVCVLGVVVLSLVGATDWVDLRAPATKEDANE